MESNYINIIPEGETKTYNASQNDSGRTIRSELFEMPMAYTLDGSENIRLRYRKPDGSVSSISVENTESTYVDITLPTEMTDQKGTVYCKLRVDGIGAKAFNVEVEGRP